MSTASTTLEGPVHIWTMGKKVRTWMDVTIPFGQFREFVKA
jgi:hypothetical protein